MKTYIIRRTCLVADYVIANRCTVRAAANIFGVSKSTIHKDLSERLIEIDPTRYEAVKRVLDVNYDERCVRGGDATKRKYAELKSK